MNELPRATGVEAFDGFADESRFWAFGTDRPLSADETATLLGGVSTFVSDWRAHGVPLTAAWSWEEGRFLWVAVDERSVPPSGCSIDAFVRHLKVIEDQLGVRLVAHGAVWYRDEAGRVQRAERTAFRSLVEQGGVTASTPVFDTSVARLADLRAGKWERSAGEAWHARAFGLA